MIDVAVLVGSCDKYADVWQAFFTLFHRYWPDCPWPVYLQTNHRDFEDPRVKVIQVGEDQDWSTSFAKFLEQIPQRYVLVLLEDYLLTAQVDTLGLTQLASLMPAHNIGYLRLFACPGPDEPSIIHHHLGIINPGALYRVSLQAALWDKEVLRDLLVPGESAWALEIQGSRRSDRLPNIFTSVWEDAPQYLPYFCTAIEKGRWLRPALRLLRREGIVVQLNRPVESWARARLRAWGLLTYYHRLRALGARFKQAS